MVLFPQMTPRHYVSCPRCASPHAFITRERTDTQCSFCPACRHLWDTRRAPANQSRVQPAVATSRLWYRAVLCDALVAAPQVPMIREHFADALGVAGWPDGACLFLGTDGSAGGEAIYFSPAAIAAVPHLIAVCGAGPSAPPERGSATLLVGNESDWDLLPRGSH
jgi:hypothetical protein